MVTAKIERAIRKLINPALSGSLSCLLHRPVGR